MTILLFIIIIGVIIFSHEFGHFLIARVSGIRVREFFIGVGPKLFKIQRGDTEYSVRLLPFGGACVFDSPDALEGEKTGQAYEEGSFLAANVWARIATIFAGPAFNFLLAYLLSLIIVAACGVMKPVVGEVVDGGAAYQAGIEKGDIIHRVDGKKIHTFTEFSMYVSMNEGKTMQMQVLRDGEKKAITVTPIYDEEAGRHYIGIRSGQQEAVKGFEIFKYGAYEVKYWADLTYKSFGMLISGKSSAKDLGGPVAVAQVVGETYEATASSGAWTVALNMMNLVVLLSVNLGIVNLFPLPALDGGKLLFMFIEVVRGKPVPPEKEGVVHLIGMAALVVLMVFVLFNDLARLFAKF